MVIIIGLLLAMGFTIMDIINLSSKANNDMESIENKTSLEEKILIPKGLEKEYSLIFQGKNPLAQHKEKKVVHTKKTEVKPEHKVNDKIDKKEKIAIKVKKKDHYLLKTKIKEYSISNDILYVDLLIYNSGDYNVKGFSNLKCEFYNNIGQVVDKFKWSGNVEIKAKKAILLKNTKFGFTTNSKDFYDIQCFVDKFSIDI